MPSNAVYIQRKSKGFVCIFLFSVTLISKGIVQALNFCPLPLGVTIGLISVHVNSVLLDLYPYCFDLIPPPIPNHSRFMKH